MSTITDSDLDALNKKINDKGDEIRQFKAAGMSKEDLLPHIDELKALKAQLPSEPSLDPPQKKEPPAKKAAAPKAPVAEEDESVLRQNRLDKVAAMKAAGVEPYEYTYAPTMTAMRLADEYKDRLENGEEDAAADVTVAGRIMTRRMFGKLAFFSLQDETGILQLQMDEERLGDTFKVSRILIIASLSTFILSRFIPHCQLLVHRI
jgi:hypothetical protein